MYTCNLLVAGADSASQSSPRIEGAYTQYGVRLSPRPFSPTPSDGQKSTLTFSLPLPTDEAVPASTTPAIPITQPLSVSVGNEEGEGEEDDEMSTRKLSKALSPRTSSAQTYNSEPASPPKPAPRQRAGVPTSLSSPPSDSSGADEVQDLGQTSPRKDERMMTVSEIVAAASKRPSGRDEDLPEPEPAPVSPKSSGSPRPSSDVDPVAAAARSPSGAASPRQEMPVFEEVAKKVSPVPTPRPRPRSPVEGKEDGLGGHLSAKENHHRELTQTEPESVAEGADGKPEVVAEVVHAHAVTITQTAPLPTAALKPKVPPPVAPKPRRTSSVESDKSGSSVHSDESPKDLSSPTLAKSKRRDLADASVPTAEEKAQNRKFVSSAARMFEQKATGNKMTSPLTHPPKSSVSVSSVVKSINREPEPEPASTVTMRKISHASRESVKPINSALLPASDRRRSMPSSLTGSSSSTLTKPSLSLFRNPPSGSGGRVSALSKPADAESDKGSRLTSALRPRYGVSSVTSLRSVIASRERKEETEPASPPTVGKSGDPRVTSTQSDVTLRSRSSAHDSHDFSSRSKHASWSPQTDDAHSPKLIFTSSSSLYHSDRNSSPSSPSSSWRSDKSDTLESTMKKFDDLLSDKHTFDSDEELPRVSNNVSFDLLKSKSARKVAASISASEKPAVEVSPVEESSAPAVPSRELMKDEARAENPPDGESTGRRAEELATGEGLAVKEVTSSTVDTEAAAVSAEQSQPSKEVFQAAVTQPVATAPFVVLEPAKREWESEKESERPKEVLAQSESVEAASEQSQPIPDRETRSEAIPSAVPEVTEVPEVTDTHPERPDSFPSDSADQDDSKADDLAEKTQQYVRDYKVIREETEDAYPEEDAAAPLDLSMAEDVYPEEDTAAPAEAADEVVYRQQASSIVQTVLADAMSDAAKLLKRDDNVEEEDDASPPPITNEDPPPLPGALPPLLIPGSSTRKRDDNVEEEDDASPPPLPSEEPPPLPGAPPPPLIPESRTKKLVDATDLAGVLPSQEAASAKSSPRSSEERASSTEASPRRDPPSADVLESDDVELEIDEAVKADRSAPNSALPIQHGEVVDPVSQNIRNDETQSALHSDVMHSFDSTPAESLPLSVNTDLLGGGLRGTGGELEHAHSDNPPVSDTLSQDSGVQDEDMFEDGLRFCQDESPTSNVDSSMFDAAMTPDEIHVSVMNGSEDGKVGFEVVVDSVTDTKSPASSGDGKVGLEVDAENVTVTKSPVPSHSVTLLQTSPGAPSSQDPTPSSAATNSLEVTTCVENVHDSLLQDSASPKCSSGHPEAEVIAPPGGASTSGDSGDDGRKADDSARVRDGEDTAENDDVQFLGSNNNANDDFQPSERDSVEIMKFHSSRLGLAAAPEPPQSAPPPPPPEGVHGEEPSLQEDPSSDSAEVVSCRKWCILDQSGSLFLHGASNARVSVAKATLRQVSSLQPAQLVSMLEAGNRDLDSAKLPKTLELRVVSARGLSGRTVKVDVTQREDHFVQVRFCVD